MLGIGVLSDVLKEALGIKILQANWSKETRKGRGWWKSNHLSAGEVPRVTCHSVEKRRSLGKPMRKASKAEMVEGQGVVGLPVEGHQEGGVPGVAPSNRDRKGTAGEEPTASSEAGSSNTRLSGPSSRGFGAPNGGGGKGEGTRLSELVTLEGSPRGFGGCYTT
ncbi:hypothetical protein K435DRAFT_809952 [Dendrothele bispora CBS 962.96]|uniref:Uncharacterized protein n=1 Tax=Dendrothele bispora (strain CBS 962.96) TaxID=1314807 RepID=A0A4S8KWK1_DENBC|nr:hypothetical protein K435DRAFT_809952 [Dendrothele bispora CBS 962.96]